MDAILNPGNTESGLAATMVRSSGITSLSGLSTMLFSSACARSFSAHTTSSGRMPMAPWRGGKNLAHPHSQAKHMMGWSVARRGNLSSTRRTTHTSCTLRCRRCTASFRSPPPPGSIHTRGASEILENLLCASFDELRHPTKQHGSDPQQGDRVPRGHEQDKQGPYSLLGPINESLINKSHRHSIAKQTNHTMHSHPTWWGPIRDLRETTAAEALCSISVHSLQS